MAKTLEQMLAERPVDRAAVEAAQKARMLDECAHTDPSATLPSSVFRTHRGKTVE